MWAYTDNSTAATATRPSTLLTAKCKMFQAIEKRYYTLGMTSFNILLKGVIWYKANRSQFIVYFYINVYGFFFVIVYVMTFLPISLDTREWNTTTAAAAKKKNSYIMHIERNEGMRYSSIKWVLNQWIQSIVLYMQNKK